MSAVDAFLSSINQDLLWKILSVFFLESNEIPTFFTRWQLEMLKFVKKVPGSIKFLSVADWPRSTGRAAKQLAAKAPWSEFGTDTDSVSLVLLRWSNLQNGWERRFSSSYFHRFCRRRQIIRESGGRSSGWELKNVLKKQSCLAVHFRNRKVQQ